VGVTWVIPQVTGEVVPLLGTASVPIARAVATDIAFLLREIILGNVVREATTQRLGEWYQQDFQELYVGQGSSKEFHESYL
jgi:hypothetical protein